MQGVGGEQVRKIRLAAPGRGKSGSFRLIFYVYEAVIIPLTIFQKNDIASIGSDALKKIMKTISWDQVIDRQAEPAEDEAAT